MDKIDVLPLGYVKNSIIETGQPGYMETESEIIFSDGVPVEAYAGIEVFSHVEIDFYYNRHRRSADQVRKTEKQITSITTPKIQGSVLFGNAIVKLVKREGNSITVKGLDAINGTQVIDIKPVMSEILPVDHVHSRI